MKKFLSLLTIFVLVAYSTMSVSANQNQDVKKYTGQEIFKGIFLAQGEVGEKLANTWESKHVEVNNSKEIIDFTDRIIEKMDEQNPTYFKNLESAIYSQNHIETYDLITEGGKLFMDIVESEVEHSTSVEIETAKEDARAQSVVWVAVALVAMTMAAVYSHAGALTFYVFAAAAKYGPGKKNSEGTETEMAVKHIIDTLNYSN